MTDEVQRLISYLRSEIIRQPNIELDQDTPLVSSGLIDSLAMVDIVFKLEEIVGLRMPRGKFRPEDLETVRSMLAATQRLGTAKP
jgi:acyl carrier protein